MTTAFLRNHHHLRLWQGATPLLWGRWKAQSLLWLLLLKTPSPRRPLVPIHPPLRWNKAHGLQEASLHVTLEQSKRTYRGTILRTEVSNKVAAVNWTSQEPSPRTAPRRPDTLPGQSRARSAWPVAAVANPWEPHMH